MEFELDDFKNYWKSHTKKETAVRFGISPSAVEKYVRTHKLYKKKIDLPINLTLKQMELVVGSMLGDGSISKPKLGKSNFIETHGSAQEDYCSWKNDLLKPFSREIVSYTKKHTVFPNGKSKDNITQVQTYTLFHPLFVELEQQWYRRDADGNYVLRANRRVKCLPPTLNLTPFSMAVWFFDDGRNCPSSRNAWISTDSFTEEECDKLILQIKSDFNITLKKQRTREGNWELYVPTTSYLDFIGLVSPYLPCESMRKKSHLIGYTPPFRTFRPRLDVDQLKTIYQLKIDGHSNSSIARILGCGKQAVWEATTGKTWKKYFVQFMK